MIYQPLWFGFASTCQILERKKNTEASTLFTMPLSKPTHLEKLLLSVHPKAILERAFSIFNNRQQEMNNSLWPSPCSRGKVISKVTYMLISADTHVWLLLTWPSNMHRPMKNKSKLRTEQPWPFAESTKKVGLRRKRRRKGIENGSCIGLRFRWEGKEVQRFFFLVNEHISPGVEVEGCEREAGVRGEGWMDTGAYLTSLLATSP